MKRWIRTGDPAIARRYGATVADPRRSSHSRSVARLAWLGELMGDALRFTSDVAVVGGCGHVGLPLAIAFADRG